MRTERDGDQGVKAKKGPEIEKKFLVAEIPDGLDQYPHEEIIQVYLGLDQPEERVRRAGDKYYFTKKTGSGIERGEEEREISEQEFNQLAEDSQGSVIRKTRYAIPLGEQKIELDIYRGDLSGNCVAEVEFEDMDQAGEFIPPEWLGEEVTGSLQYSNRVLAEKGWPESKGKEIVKHELE